MSRFFFVNILFIALTAPWIFLVVGQEASVGGLPLWAIYTVGASVVYALFVAISYARLWDISANAEDDE